MFDIAQISINQNFWSRRYASVSLTGLRFHIWLVKCRLLMVLVETSRGTQCSDLRTSEVLKLREVCFASNSLGSASLIHSALYTQDKFTVSPIQVACSPVWKQSFLLFIDFATVFRCLHWIIIQCDRLNNDYGPHNRAKRQLFAPKVKAIEIIRLPRLGHSCCSSIFGGRIEWRWEMVLMKKFFHIQIMASKKNCLGTRVWLSTRFGLWDGKHANISMCCTAAHRCRDRALKRREFHWNVNHSLDLIE